MKSFKSQLASYLKAEWSDESIFVDTYTEQGVGGKVLLATCKDEKYIIKLVGEWVSETSLHKTVCNIVALNQQNISIIPTLRPMKNSLYGKTGGRLFYAISYTEGVAHDKSADSYEILAESIADIHKVKTPYASEKTIDGLVDAVRKNSTAYKFGKDLNIILDKYFSISRKLTEGTCHLDLSTNHLIKSGKSLVLIDLDDLGNGPLVLDLGGPLINQFISEDLVFDQNKSKSFFNSYSTRNTHLPRDEYNFIFNCAMIMACFYLPFGDTTKRWERILWADTNRASIESTYI